MPESHLKKSTINKLLLRSAQFPVFYFLVGCIFDAISYIDDLLFVKNWNNGSEIIQKIGHVLITFAIITFVYNFLSRLSIQFEKLATANKHTVASLVLASLRRGLKMIYFLIALNLIISSIGHDKYYLIFANQIINAVIIASIGWVAFQILYTFEAVIYHYTITPGTDKQERAKALYNKIHILKNVAGVVIVILCIGIILMTFKSVRSLGISLLASAGFFTAIMGLAAQKGLASMFSGIQIALTQPIQIGDVVLIENEQGTIEEITFTYVILKFSDFRRMVVPINYFIDKPFQNWSRNNGTLKGTINFYTDYNVPVQAIRTELHNVLQMSPNWDGLVGAVQVANFKENSIELRIRLSAKNADMLSDLRAEVRERILEFIRTHYPDSFPKLHVSMKPLAETDITQALTLS